jgi:RNA polymerase sigma factor (sigma-70 family)
MGKMIEKSDAQLLREYALEGAEAAFAELVARHANLVYSAATRQTDSPGSAADIAQGVFIVLAQSAQKLSARVASDASLAGWLCRTARNLSLNFRRNQLRQSARDRHAMENLALTGEPAPDWDRLRPILDEVMSELAECDYDAIVLRFYNNQDFSAVGRALGVNQNTAQKRVARALEKLQKKLLRRGITAPAAALSVALSANAVQLAPVGWVAALPAAALSKAAATSLAANVAAKAIGMTTLQKTLVVALALAAAAGIYETLQAAHLHARLQTTTAQESVLSGRLGTLQSEREQAFSRLAAVRADLAREQSHDGELLRVRSKLGPLLAASQELALIKAAETNEAMQTAVHEWIARALDLQKRVMQLPGKFAPEIKYLSATDWLDAAKDPIPNDEDAINDAVDSLKYQVRVNVADLMRFALAKYLADHNGDLPVTVFDLKPLFPTMDDEILDRYEMRQSGNIGNLGGDAKDALMAEKPTGKGHRLFQIGANGWNVIQQP